jgi:hypothetical protein
MVNHNIEIIVDQQLPTIPLIPADIWNNRLNGLAAIEHYSNYLSSNHCREIAENAASNNNVLLEKSRVQAARLWFESVLNEVKYA